MAQEQRPLSITGGRIAHYLPHVNRYCVGTIFETGTGVGLRGKQSTQWWKGKVKTPTRKTDVWGTKPYFPSRDRATRR